MDQDQIAAMERQMLEEHRKDLEALARLKRFLPLNGNGNGVIDHVARREAVVNFVPEEGSSLRDAICGLLSSDPNVRWTNQKIFSYLQSVNFPLNAKKPIVSVAQATQRLEGHGEIVLMRQGTGNTPNVYRGLVPEERAKLDAERFKLEDA